MAADAECHWTKHIWTFISAAPDDPYDGPCNEWRCEVCGKVRYIVVELVPDGEGRWVPRAT